VKEGTSIVWLAAAAAAEFRAAILERHRTGEGKWTATVEAFECDPEYANEDLKLGKLRVIAQTKCDTKGDAEAEAKRLLAEHASEARENVEIEANIYCDLQTD
jgi:hypothetical protein